MIAKEEKIARLSALRDDVVNNIESSKKNQKEKVNTNKRLLASIDCAFNLLEEAKLNLYNKQRYHAYSIAANMMIDAILDSVDEEVVTEKKQSKNINIVNEAGKVLSNAQKNALKTADNVKKSAVSAKERSDKKREASRTPIDLSDALNDDDYFENRGKRQLPSKEEETKST